MSPLTKGEKEKVDNIENRVIKIESEIASIKSTLRGIAIGLIIGGGIFGIKELIGLFTKFFIK